MSLASLGRGFEVLSSSLARGFWVSSGSLARGFEVVDSSCSSIQGVCVSKGSVVRISDSKLFVVFEVSKGSVMTVMSAATLNSTDEESFLPAQSIREPYVRFCDI